MKLTYLRVIYDARLSSVEFVEKNVRVGVGEHKSPGEVIPRYESIRLAILIPAFKHAKRLLDIEMWILKQQLPFLLNHKF